MRKGLFLCALLATAMIGGTALAERTNTDNKPSRGQQIKERVLAKQREGFAKTRASHQSTQHTTAPKVSKMRPKGEVYGDQATRTRANAATVGRKNLSATNTINTPAEIKKMMHMVNPMYGAYRTAQDDQSAEAYGGRSMSPQGYHNATTGASSVVTSHVHFKNDKGEVMTSTMGNTATAMKNRHLKNEIMGLLKAKMAEKAKIAGK